MHLVEHAASFSSIVIPDLAGSKSPSNAMQVMVESRGPQLCQRLPHIAAGQGHQMGPGTMLGFNCLRSQLVDCPVAVWPAAYCRALRSPVKCI